MAVSVIPTRRRPVLSILRVRTGSGIGYAFELGYGCFRRSFATFPRRREGIDYVSRIGIVLSVIFFFNFGC